MTKLGHSPVWRRVKIRRRLANLLGSSRLAELLWAVHIARRGRKIPLAVQRGGSNWSYDPSQDEEWLQYCRAREILGKHSKFTAALTYVGWI